MSGKHRKMLNDWQAPYIQDLIRQIETQSKETLVGWALDYAEKELLPLWENHCPSDSRPRQAIDAARAWLSGTSKLPEAKLCILQCHSAAREQENNPIAQAAARAIAQCAATIHSAQHCIGLALYGALALSYAALGVAASWKELEQYAAGECSKMLKALKAISVANEAKPARIKWTC